MKYQFEDWLRIVLLSHAGKALSSLLNWLVLVRVYSHTAIKLAAILMMILLQENYKCINGAGVIDEGPAHIRADINPGHH